MRVNSVKRATSKIFYGYVVVAVSVLILIVMHGIGSSYGVFFKSLQNEFSANRATISGASSLAFFLEGLFSVFIGRLNDRLGPRKVLTACGIITGIGYFLMSRTGSILQLYLFYGVAVGMGVSSGNVVLLSTVARWFVKRRGLMSGILKVGTGGGMFIMPLVASWLILNYGWRQAYLLLAIVGLMDIVALSQFLKRDPAQMHLEPYGTGEKDSASAKIPGIQFTFKEAIRTRQFWLISITYFIATYVTQSIMIHIVAYATDNGISVGSAAGLVSTIGGVSIVGRIVMGGASDRIGNKRALLVSFVVLVAALSWLQFAGGLWMLYLFAGVYGFAHGGMYAVMSPLVAEMFGTTYLGANFGMVMLFNQTGGALGPLAAGRIFDVTHSYKLAFLIALIAGISALILTGTLKQVKSKGKVG